MSSLKGASRDGVYRALVELGRENKDVVVLDADLCGSTGTYGFKKEFPTRFFDCGIAECNMIGVAAGLSCVGKIPFAASFAMFCVGRAYDQLRNSVAYTNLNVKIIGAHAGLCAAADGATHQCLEDLALARVISNMLVLCPCDYIETICAIKASSIYKGPVYIRSSKFAICPINQLDYLNKFEIGKGVVLKDGNMVCIIATGVEVYFALKAARLLEVDGVSTMVLNIHTIKPLDKDLILKAAKKTQFLFTVEEHSVLGGLGEAVCSFLAQEYPTFVKTIGVIDSFGHSGDALELLKGFKLDENGIYKTIKEVMAKKSSAVKRIF